VALLVTALPACVGRPEASYNWQFRQISADAKDKDRTFTACEASAKRSSRQIRNDSTRIWSFVEALEFCMRQNGWESQGRPVTITYV
jgi:hypothetical protein